MTDLVLAQRQGAVLVLTFNRPDKLNAWTNDLEGRYFELLLDADDDPTVGAIVVTGAGRGFCSGADLNNLKHVGAVQPEDLARARPRDLPRNIRKPLIGAINGVAAGLGMVEALYCDVRFAGAATRFTTAFARRGLIAEYGISWMLARLVGTSRAADLLLSSRMVDAEEAYRIGLVDHLVPQEGLLAAAIGYATDLATYCSPQSLATMKAQLHTDTSYADAAAHADQLMLAAFHAPDVIEGVTSYLEKRPPNFPPLPPGSPRV
ncbi:MAG: enoyl-CoA hydratase-related protein [Mycobacteriaceae bacterium]